MTMAPDTTDPEAGTEPRPAAAPAGRSLRTALLAITAVALLLLGGGAAVALGIGKDAVPSSDSVDAGFARDMSRHHIQGVEMANLALERSSDPEIRLIAFDISSTQTNQAGRMQGWLALWDLPVSGGQPMSWMGASAGGDMSGMEGMEGMGSTESTGSSAAGLMPGMASEDELTNLRQLSGATFDVEFLRLMIRHHQGGKEMAQYGARHAVELAVRNLASAIADTQAAEVRTMTDMLTARGGTPLPAP